MNKPRFRSKNARLTVVMTVSTLVIVALAMLTASVSAGESASASNSAAATNGSNVDRSAALTHVGLLAGWMDKAYGTIESALSSQTRVLQIGMIAMLLALWIIWWRK